MVAVSSVAEMGQVQQGCGGVRVQVGSEGRGQRGGVGGGGEGRHMTHRALVQPFWLYWACRIPLPVPVLKHKPVYVCACRALSLEPGAVGAPREGPG